MYLMMPATFACSYAYCLPISKLRPSGNSFFKKVCVSGTPPNALAAVPCNMPTKEMVKAGVFVTLICASVTFGLFPHISGVVFDLGNVSDWTEPQANQTTVAL